MKVRLEGFFPVKTKIDKEEVLPRYQDSMVLDAATYKLSVREFTLENLEILPLERYWGGCIFGIPLVGVVDTGSELYPFFIEKTKVSKLQKMLKALDKRPIRI